MDQEYGTIAAVFCDGKQVGKIAKWTLSTETALIAPNSLTGGVEFRKIKSWQVSALRYVLDKPIDNVPIELHYEARNAHLVLKGTLLSKAVTIGTATNGVITFGGKGGPKSLK